MPKETSSEIPKSNEVLVDTCTLSGLLARSSLGNSYRELLEKIKETGGVPALCDVTINEMTSGQLRRKQFKAFSKAVEQFKIQRVNNKLSSFQARLARHYREALGRKHGISEGDTRIAATAILDNTLILTDNGKHFPAQIFNRVAVKTLKWKTKEGKDQSKKVYLIRAKEDYVKEHLSEEATVKGEEKTKV